MWVHCTRYKKHAPFTPPLCVPLALGTKILTCEIWFRPTYACKILSGAVKVCRSYSQNFLRCHAYTWQHKNRYSFRRCFDICQDNARTGRHQASESADPEISKRMETFRDHRLIHVSLINVIGCAVLVSLPYAAYTAAFYSQPICTPECLLFVWHDSPMFYIPIYDLRLCIL